MGMVEVAAFARQRRRGAARGDDDTGRNCDEFLGQSGQPLGLVVCAYRYSIRTVRPISYPACFKARWMAPTGPEGASADHEEASRPIAGVADCCARAGNDQWPQRHREVQ